LDKQKGGSFSIHPTQIKDVKYKQLYIPGSNILLTRFLLKEGVGEVTDFMPIEDGKSTRRIIRKISSVRGKINYAISCNPFFDYAKSSASITKISENEIVFKSHGNGQGVLKLISSVPLNINQENNSVCASLALKFEETAVFVLEYNDQEDSSCSINSKVVESYVEGAFSSTLTFWKNWVSMSQYKGRWLDTVDRSSLILKLLSSKQYGSIVASPTFSLPEFIGGERNWDYRYTWIRDSSFTMDVLIKLGFYNEAKAFMKWVETKCEGIGKSAQLGLMFRIDGTTQLEEKTLDHLEGYKNSKPVRIGNKAFRQLQQDIYGELIDAVYLFDLHVQFISYHFWNSIKAHIDWVSTHWKESDNSIWEVRSEKKYFLYSKLMCWVTLDRGIKIAEKRSFPYPDSWRNERDDIFNSIHEDLWNDSKKSFVQYRGSDSVDASILLMPLVGFIGAKDPKWLSTLEFIEKELVSDCMVHRYRHEKFNDGIRQGEGTFTMCSFWYIECLSRSGQLEKARFYFEKLLGYANHLGLYSEQLGFQGEHLGNFPQAFSHLALINAAYDLNNRLNTDSSYSQVVY
jgi:GH15 family glucan-1,4-alpha-glucosidase